MKFNFRKLFYILPLLVLSFPNQAESRGPGTSSYEFLNIPDGARETAMGGATAITLGGSGYWWNPAAISYLERNRLTLSQNTFFEGISRQRAGWAWLMPDRSAAAVNLNIQSIRGIDGYDWLGTPTSELSAASYVLSYTQGKRFTNLLAVGLSLKGILEKLDTESSFGAAVDGGVLLEPSDHIHLAVGFKNLGVSGSFIEENDTLPFTGFAGFGFRINRFMLLAADAYLLNKELRFAGGIETNLFRTLFFRAGWSGLSDIPDSFNFGSGFELKDITFDYAWMPNEELGNTHRIELSYEFGKPSLIEELYRRGRKYFAKAQYDNAFIEFGKVSSLDNNYKHIKSWLEKTQLELRKDPEDSEDP